MSEQETELWLKQLLCHDTNKHIASCAVSIARCEDRRKMAWWFTRWIWALLIWQNRRAIRRLEDHKAWIPSQVSK